MGQVLGSCVIVWDPEFPPDFGWGKDKKGGILRLASSDFVKSLKYLYLIAIFKTFIELFLTFLDHFYKSRRESQYLSQLIYWKMNASTALTFGFPIGRP